MTSGFLKGRGLAPLWVALSALGLSGAALAADAPAETDKCKVHSIAIPVRVADSRPIATVKLNGAAVPLLLDSGAFFSVLSEISARQLGLPLRAAPADLRVYGFTGEIKNIKATRVQSVEIAGEVIRDVDFMVGGNDLDAGMMGILGRNILSVADTEYDLAHGIVRLMFPKGDCRDMSMAYWAGDAPVIEVPLIARVRGDKVVRVPVLLNGRTTEALMDTGAPTSVLTLAAARRAGIAEENMTLVGRSGGAGVNLLREWSADVDRFELGGEKVTHNQFRVSEVSSRDYDMVLGLDYFLSHRVYVSRLQGKVYATWNGGSIFAKGEARRGEGDPRYAAKGDAIRDDDADALARRGNASLVRGDAARALEDLDKAVRLQPTAVNFDARSRAQMALKRPREALADLDEALRLDPALAQSRLRRVPLRMGFGDETGARADLAELDTALAPSSNLRWQVAGLHSRRNEPELAIKQYDLWIQSHPGDVMLASAMGQRCWIRTRMNVELEKALEDCKMAATLDKGDPLVKSFLGWTYLRAGDLAQSLRAFDASIKLMAMPVALYGRGLARLRAGDAVQGQRDIEAARRERPAIDAQARRQGLDVAPGAPMVAGPKDAVEETEDH